jgi:hypothetical protein
MTREERILEARRMLDAGEFDRAVTANEPEDLLWNRLTLECGHWTQWCSKIHFDKHPPDRERCHQCAKAWIAAEESA